MVSMNPEEASEQIEKDLREKDAQQELFQKRVIIIGELHTERALWANKFGQLKSLSITQNEELSDEYDSKLKDLESRISEISQEITDFKPESIEELEQFKEEIEVKFKALEPTYNELMEANSSSDSDQKSD